MSKKIFFILKCLCINIEMCAIRQWPNAAELVNLWFCTKNHLKMAKVCNLGQLKVIYGSSNHADTLKTLS